MLKSMKLSDIVATSTDICDKSPSQSFAAVARRAFAFVLLIS